MLYIKTHWLHQRPDEPVWLYSELDDGRWEVRKVEVFRDGSMGYAGPGESAGSTWLGEVPVPSLEEINSSKELESVDIEPAEFERIWAQRRHPLPPLAEAEFHR